jgi:ubiquinone/menaquinone biosynthesis C-methylase UbiE
VLYGVDGDRSILQLASSKIARFRSDVRIVAGLANRLPLRSDSVDRVFSTLMLHHLTHAEKVAPCLNHSESCDREASFTSLTGDRRTRR